MADKEIGDLTAASTLGTADLIHVVQGGNSRKATGAQVRQLGGRFERGPPTVPSVASLTWSNQGTSTASDGTEGIVFTPQSDGVVHYLFATTPAAPFDVYMRVDFNVFSTAANTTFQQAFFGIALRDNSDSETFTFSPLWSRVSGDEQNEYKCVGFRWAGTTFNATPLETRGPRNWPWLRVNVTSTTITCYISPDGKNWVQVGTETIATFLDTVDRYGIVGYNETNGTAAVGVISYFSTTAPA